MKQSVLLFPTFIFLIISFSSQAQFINRIKNAAERGVSKAIEKKVESEMEKMARRKLDRMFKDVYGTDNPDSLPGVDKEKMMSSIYNDIEVEESYGFEGFAIMEITGLDETGKQNEPIHLTTFYSNDPKITAMKFTDMKKKEDGTYILIYDFNRNAGITLMENEGEKMRITFAYDYETMSETDPSKGNAENNIEEVTFKKTGNSKNILGQECEEYFVETSDNITHYWVTKISLTGQTPFWSQNNPFLTARMKETNPDLFENLPSGNMMEAHVVSKLDQSKIDMITLELHENNKQSFLMADYPSISQSMK